ncbi:MAG TPA: glycosyltransferase family 4 protein, partial [Spirochaetota bacterium]|nr:glycosyltransferase family 4 protein [Spirochaetota bacterium]
MKILLVNTLDNYGGAARACYRLHKALLEEGIDSKMLVQLKTGDDWTVLGPRTDMERSMGKVRSIIEKIPLKKYNINVTFSLNISPFSPVVERINEINPDIVHLHWVNDGFLKIENIPKIKPPIIWTMHDMWLFTGGCHYDEYCDRFKKNCGRCPVLNSNKENDLSRKTWNRKNKAFSKIKNMLIVGPGKWHTECAKDSLLLKNRKIWNIPNPIDTNVFKPFDKIKARELFGLPINKKLILFGAMSNTDKRKGLKELKEALHKIKNINDIELVIFGSSPPEKEIDFGFKSYYLGRLNDDPSLVALYNAVDIVINASHQENLSNVIMESISCGKPVVAFNIGGNPDMIDHQINGYLAKPFDTDDLANGIKWVLNNPDYNELCKNAREKVLNNFDKKIVVKRYIELYKEILKN